MFYKLNLCNQKKILISSKKVFENVREVNRVKQNYLKFSSLEFRLAKTI